MKTVKSINRQSFKNWLTSLHPHTKVGRTATEDVVDRFMRISSEAVLAKSSTPKWVKDFRKVLGTARRDHPTVTARRATTVLESI